jgi:glycosyltransferase involved in cell wall biosynthesis
MRESTSTSISNHPASPTSPVSRDDLEKLRSALEGKLNLLVVCLSHSWGGLEQVAVNDAEDVAALGLQVKFMCLEGSPAHLAVAQKPQIQAIPLDYTPRDTLDFGLKRDLEAQFKAGVNLVHTHQPTLLGSLSPWLWSHPGVALVASRHILNNHNKRNLVHRLIYSRVDALVAMSETLRANILATHPVSAAKVKVVRLGLDFDRFDPSKVDPARQREAWGATEETVVVGLVGRIDPAKGQETFIKAAASLMRSLPRSIPVKFVIVGEETLGRSGEFLDYLRDLVRQFHLENLVLFAGYQQNIPEVMRSFDLFVMPSKQEAFGLVAIEAMAMECPIIISSGGSAEEIIGRSEGKSEDQLLGLLVRPEDAFDLQAKIKQLLDSPQKRRLMGARAREHVLHQYDRLSRRIGTLDLYSRALRRRSHLN